MSDLLLPIRDLLGINRRDGGERSSDREFYAITNLFPKEKGQYTVRGGSSYDLQSSDIPGCDRITAIHRHTSHPCQNSTLFHCTPTATKLTHPGSTGLTITEVTSASGTIFDAANPASKKVRFCHSYIGMGVESTWDTRTRAGFVPYAGLAVPVWDQAGLQTITMTSTTDTLEVSHPAAFPADVRSVNVFMSMGDGTDGAEKRGLVYVGTLYSNSDVLTVDVSMGIAAGSDTITDANFTANAISEAGSDIPTGQYYVSLAWVSSEEYNWQQVSNLNYFGSVKLCTAKAVQITGAQNAIGVHHYEVGAASTNGATHCYVFIGTKSETEAPMVCVGSFRVDSVAFASTYLFKIASIPVNTNASSSPTTGTMQSTYSLRGGILASAGQSKAFFTNVPLMHADENKARHGFIVKRDPDRSVEISEVFPSRSRVYITDNLVKFDGTNYLSVSDEYNYYRIRTSQDRDFSGNAAAANSDISEPSLTYFFGESYLANGNNFLQTDGITINDVIVKEGCALPTSPFAITTFKSQLVCLTKDGLTVGSNALQPNNFSDGGTGTDLRFAILGDPQSSKAATLSRFSFTSGTEGPRSFLVVGKKNSLWSLTDIPDSTSGINATGNEMSGRVGCIAQKTMVHTKIGLLFLGSDGLVYIVRGNGEPFSVSGKIKPILSHLALNDTLMKLCSAEWHGDYYKLAYPSAADSTYCDAQLWADLRTEDGDNIMWNGPHTGINIGCQLVLNEEGDNGSRICGLANATGTAVLDDETLATDLGTAITSVLEWNRRKFKAELNFKRFSGIFLDVVYNSGEDHSLLYELFSDREYTQENKVVCVGDPDTAENVYETINMLIGPDNLIGRDFKFRITHTGGRNFTIAAAAIPYKPEKRAIV